MSDITQQNGIQTNGIDYQNGSAKNFGKRVVFNGTQADPMFQIESKVELPQLNDGEVLVKVKAATICLSDIHTVCGTRTEPTPSVLGHEACVEVVAHKRGDDCDLKPGDRCTFSIADSCGECEFCTNDLSQKCVKLFKYGHAHMSNGSGFNGCYSSHIIIRKGTMMFKLPDQISDSLASSINCALATMVNCVENLPQNVKKSKKKALVQGDGTLGVYGCSLLKEMGFELVYCSGHHQSTRSEIIKKFGALPIQDEIGQLKDQHNTFDCVIEVCGNSDVVPNGVKLLKPGGAYMFVGTVHPNSSLTITGEQIIRKCLTIKGVHNYQGYHLKTAVEFLTKNISKYPFEMLVSPKYFNLDQLPEAIELAKTKSEFRICIKP